jgi:hypothetical protein
MSTPSDAVLQRPCACSELSGNTDGPTGELRLRMAPGRGTVFVCMAALDPTPGRNHGDVWGEGSCLNATRTAGLRLLERIAPAKRGKNRDASLPIQSKPACRTKYSGTEEC